MPRGEGWTLVREELMGDAILRELRCDGLSTTRCFEYELEGCIWRSTWDGREDGNVFYVTLRTWDEPADQPISPAQRSQLVQRMSSFASGILMRENVEGKPVMPEMGPAGFVLEVSCHTQIRYWEANHLLELDCHTGPDGHLVVDVPQQKLWTYPAGQPVGANAWDRILERIATTAGEERLDQLGVLIDVPDHGTSPGFYRPKHYDKELRRRQLLRQQRKR